MNTGTKRKSQQTENGKQKTLPTLMSYDLGFGSKYALTLPVKK